MSDEVLQRLLRRLQEEIDKLDADELAKIEEAQKAMDEKELVNRAVDKVREQLGIDLTDPGVRSDLAKAFKDLGINVEKLRRQLG